jgi:hypothetical protein
MTQDQEQKILDICEVIADNVHHHFLDQQKKIALRERLYQLSTEIIKIANMKGAQQ